MKYRLASLLALESSQTNAQNKAEPNLLLDVETSKFIDSNPEADTFFNLSIEQLALLSPLGLGPKIIYPAQQTLAHLQQSLKLALAGGNPVLHWHFLNQEGESNPCEVMLVRFPPYDRSFVRFIFQDREEQSIAQKKINQQAALLENVSDAIFSTDTDFKIQYWNKAAEEKLAPAQAEINKLYEKYQLAIQSARVGIWDWDLQTNEFVWDDMMYKLYGLTKGEVDINYELWAKITHPDDLAKAEQNIQDVLAGKDEIQSDVRIIWPDQSIRHIRTRVILQRDETGEPSRMLGTNWDLTKEKEIEQAKVHSSLLEVRNKELEQFAYVASHDLKEPIRTMISFASLLKKRHSQDLNQDAQEYLEFIYLAANRMNDLVKGLLEYSRLGINKELSSVNCQIVIQTVLRDLKTLIDEKKAIIEVKDLPTIPGYQTELRILFQNLISNGIKFSKLGSPPVISVSATLEGTNWVFCFTDNGIGIEPQYLHKVFELFQRLNPQKQYEGTGIGLANCQKIADLHGGKIWVESQIDKGSSFYVSLPDTFFQEESLS